VGREPAPEYASRRAGRGASTTDRTKLAPKRDPAHGQTDEHSGALLGLDRQPRDEREAAAGEGTFEALGAGRLKRGIELDARPRERGGGDRPRPGRRLARQT
jgi:hypothetical protein